MLTWIVTLATLVSLVAGIDPSGAGLTEAQKNAIRTYGFVLQPDSAEFKATETTFTPGLGTDTTPWNPLTEWVRSVPAPWLPHDPCPGNSFSDGYCWSDPPAELDPANPITIADVISFAPAPSVPAAEPGAFALRNLHTNFIADGTTHIRSGLLLGEPASAEFTPVAFEWHYGDGATQTSRTPGATWQQLGRAEFDRTDSSHAYVAKGSYQVTLRTHYAVRASYASDGQWFRVPGTLTVTSAPLTIQVMTVKTVLVDQDCNANPSGPGC